MIRLALDLLLVASTIVPLFFGMRYLFFATRISEELGSRGRSWRYWYRAYRLRRLGLVYLLVGVIAGNFLVGRVADF